MHSAISFKLALAASLDDLPWLVGRSPAIRRLEEAIARVGHVDCPVLLTGETGCGKDEAARAIHAAGSRATRPFVAKLLRVLELREVVPVGATCFPLVGIRLASLCQARLRRRSAE